MLYTLITHKTLNINTCSISRLCSINSHYWIYYNNNVIILVLGCMLDLLAITFLLHYFFSVLSQV